MTALRAAGRGLRSPIVAALEKIAVLLVVALLYLFGFGPTVGVLLAGIALLAAVASLCGVLLLAAIHLRARWRGRKT
jgi:Na+-driven multidrug efflux pump